MLKIAQKSDLSDDLWDNLFFGAPDQMVGFDLTAFFWFACDLKIRFNAQGLRHNLREPGVFCVKKNMTFKNVWNRHEWGAEPYVLV